MRYKLKLPLEIPEIKIRFPDLKLNFKIRENIKRSQKVLKKYMLLICNESILMKS